MNIQTLITEIENDPLAVGYQSMSTEEITTSLNTVNRTRLRLLNSRELLAWSSIGAIDASGVKSRYERFEDGAVNHSSAAIRGVCKAAVKLIERDTTELDLNLSDRQAMVGALVAGGVITSDEEQELYTLSTENISRGEELNLGHVKHGHVIMAREAMGGE